MTAATITTRKTVLRPRTKEEFRSIWSDLQGLPFCVEWVDAGGVRTRSLQAGAKDAPGLIMIPGTGGHLETFSGNIGAHARHFNTHAIDFLGHGFTDKPDFDYDMKAGAKFLIDYMDAVGFEKASFVGVSLGSWYAIQFAYQHPERVEKLSLISPSGGPGHHSPPGRAPTDLEDKPFEGGNARQEAADNPTWAAAEKIVKGLVADETLTDDIIAARLAVSKQPGASQAMRHILWTRSIQRRIENCLTEEQLGTIEAPALLIVGEPGEIERARVKPFVDNLPNAQVVYWEGVCHWPHWDDPATFNEFNIEFLTS